MTLYYERWKYVWVYNFLNRIILLLFFNVCWSSLSPLQIFSRKVNFGMKMRINSSFSSFPSLISSWHYDLNSLQCAKPNTLTLFDGDVNIVIYSYLFLTYAFMIIPGQWEIRLSYCRKIDLCTILRILYKVKIVRLLLLMNKIIFWQYILIATQQLSEQKASLW